MNQNNSRAAALWSGSVRLEEVIWGWDELVVVKQGGSRFILLGDGKLLDRLRCEHIFNNLVCNSVEILFQCAILSLTKSGSYS